ncbi:MAG: DUF4349 domain-containing protein [Rickettsiales bacterium]|jgi:hypothetical protein|nr:DUF4349 domain-containing protein [Rickettsiales bacterium]
MEKIKNFVENNILFVLVLLALVFFFNNKKQEQIVPRPFLDRMRMVDNDIIQTYTFDFSVDDVEKTNNDLKNTIKAFNGEIVNFSSNNNYYNYVIRISTEFMPQFLIFTKTIGNIKSENNNSYNITEQEENNKSKLEKLLLQQKRISNLLKGTKEQIDFYREMENLDSEVVKGKNIREVNKNISNNAFKDTREQIEIIKELSKIEDEIARLEKTIANINKNVNFTKISISFSPEIYSNWNYKNSWNDAIKNAIIFKERAIDLTFNLVIFSPIILIIYFITRKKRKIHD